MVMYFMILRDTFFADSTELKGFLKNLKPEYIILIASADDAGHK